LIIKGRVWVVHGADKKAVISFGWRGCSALEKGIDRERGSW
jgi:hypothetical protein